MSSSKFLQPEVIETNTIKVVAEFRLARSIKKIPGAKLPMQEPRLDFKGTALFRITIVYYNKRKLNNLNYNDL